MSFTDKEISDRIESNNKLVNKIQDKMDLIKKQKTEQFTIHNVSDSFFALYPYNGKPHFGSSKTKTFCGMDVPDGMNKPLPVKIENKELMELWNEDCEVQQAKWVRVSKHYKCKRCLKTLEKNYH